MNPNNRKYKGKPENYNPNYKFDPEKKKQKEGGVPFFNQKAYK